MTSGQTSSADALPFFLADYVLQESNTGLVRRLLEANEELMVYIVSSNKLSAPIIKELVASDVLSIDCLLRKLSLFLPYVQASKEISDAVFLKLRSFSFRVGQTNISIDEVQNYLTLVKSLDCSFTETALCSLNTLLNLQESQSNKAFVARILKNFLNEQKTNINATKQIQVLMAVIQGEEDASAKLLTQAEVNQLCETILDFTSLRRLILPIKVLPTKNGVNVDQICAVVTNLLPLPKSNLDFSTFRYAFRTLKEGASEEDFVKSLLTFF